ncbi:MAG TPA: 50S ribosomal protein L11 methyltransferase [Mesorhizobium sp.]|uniref:class I SAM-dependent methyltransferase n=1 Tax=Mesorhizobium sp. TaxID=1871066 RepID=UPI002DDCF85D|nr:50S ribosomal protein L11 methyltransferase [Mesorhizobium sp.]HEV2502573.1 50S ribosomal protein L11 methyltransferase [Mesorhizobium sp.]
MTAGPSDTIQRDSTADLAAFIAANLPVTPVPGIPEIRLHGAHSGSGLRRLAEQRSTLSPYWAYRWAGGAVLARHLLDHPETVQGRTVLDLGTGSGLVAIAAAKAGAGRVVAADIDAHAIAATRLNAVLNDVTVEPLLADLTSGEPPRVDLLMVGDLFYESRLARRVTAFLDRCLTAGITVLVGDPGRAHLPRRRLKAIAEYRVTDFGTAAHAATPATVFSFIREC